MNLYFNNDYSADTLVVFYIRCTDCDKVLIDYHEFYYGTTEDHKALCANHTEETAHTTFHLGSIVRTFACGDCGESWEYKEDLSEWQKLHFRKTNHSFFGFMPVTKDMYQ